MRPCGGCGAMVKEQDGVEYNAGGTIHACNCQRCGNYHFPRGSADDCIKYLAGEIRTLQDFVNPILAVARERSYR